MTQDKQGTDGARAALPFPTSENHPIAAKPAHAPKTEEPSEDALDHGIEESFPASDPVSVSVTTLVPKKPAPASPPLMESVAGEEDPGASIDLQDPAGPGAVPSSAPVSKP